MKTILRFALLVIATAFFQFSYGQITKLSNNTGLTGFLLNNKPILGSDLDNTFWTTDGTPAGTKQYTTKVIADSTQNGGASLMGGKLYFAGMDAANGSELWVTDGTDAGTTLIKDIEPGTGSSTPTDFFTFNNQVFFFAQTAAAGYELWKTDGTTAGTVMVKDIVAGADGSVDNDTFVGYFTNNSNLFFTLDDGVHGNELWKTDGSDAGTMMVKDINPGDGDGIADYPQFIALGTLTLFAANDGTGSELWKTDGTEAGTVRVKDISTDTLGIGSRPNNFVAFNNKIYFDALTVNEGDELWATDGTEAGTNMVADITPGTASSAPSLDNSIIFGNHLVFTATDSAYVPHLWSTDGTAPGTVLIKDFNVAPYSFAALLTNYRSSDLSFSNIHTPPYNGKAFIGTYTEQATQLWITDGTAAGTGLVKDIYTGSGSNSNYFLFGDYYYTANNLFFAAQGSDAAGVELWKSDGSTAGTGLVKDINPGAKSSNPFFDFEYNNQLYITADDGDNTDSIPDLFVVDENVTLPISLFNFAAAAQPSKAVKLEWNTTNELNSSHFDIERSADGINFGKIEEVKAAGNSGLNQRYQYTDLQPVHLRNPVLFYRLKMVDKDAAFKYSQVLPVHFTENSLQFSFSPNPVQDQLSVIVAAPGSKSVALRVTDAAGKQVYQHKLSSAQTVNQQNINVAGWGKGIYYIQLITDTSVKTSKFVKQ